MGTAAHGDRWEGQNKQRNRRCQRSQLHRTRATETRAQDPIRPSCRDSPPCFSPLSPSRLTGLSIVGVDAAQAREGVAAVDVHGARSADSCAARKSMRHSGGMSGHALKTSLRHAQRSIFISAPVEMQSRPIRLTLAAAAAEGQGGVLLVLDLHADTNTNTTNTARDPRDASVAHPISACAKYAHAPVRISGPSTRVQSWAAAGWNGVAVTLMSASRIMGPHSFMLTA